MKKTLVCIHYFGGDSGSWQWLLPYLEKDYRCIVVDLPGFGDAPPLKELNLNAFSEFLLRFLEDEEMKDVVMMGHSMGGKIVLNTVLLDSDQRISKVVLLTPSPPSIEKMPQKEKDRMLNHPDHQEAVTTVERVTVAPLHTDRFNYAVNSQLTIDPATWRWWIIEGMNENIATKTKELSIPISVIASKEDAAVTIEMLEEEIMPNLPAHTTLHFIDHVGHLIPMEKPEALAEVLRKIM